VVLLHSTKEDASEFNGRNFSQKSVTPSNIAQKAISLAACHDLRRVSLIKRAAASKIY